MTIKFHSFWPALLIAGMAATGYGAQVFNSTFDAAGTSSTLVGVVAETGQVWAESPKAEVNDSRGKGTLGTDPAYGQLSTVGAGAAQEGYYWQGNSIDLGQTISEGILRLDFDFKRHRTSGHNGSAELVLSLASDNQEMALIWNGGYLKVGGSIIGYDQGAWQKTMDMAISTGNVHVQLFLDMDAQTGTLSYDQYDATNSGSVNLDPITQGDISFDRIWLTLRTMDETMGYDNIAIDYQALIIPGDANYDGIVDDNDAAVLALNWQSGPDAAWAMGDFNADGWVNDSDATILAPNWQAGVLQTTSVPEPGGIVLLLCGMALAAMWIRR